MLGTNETTKIYSVSQNFIKTIINFLFLQFNIVFAVGFTVFVDALFFIYFLSYRLLISMILLLYHPLHHHSHCHRNTNHLKLSSENLNVTPLSTVKLDHLGSIPAANRQIYQKLLYTSLHVWMKDGKSLVSLNML